MDTELRDTPVRRRAAHNGNGAVRSGQVPSGREEEQGGQVGCQCAKYTGAFFRVAESARKSICISTHLLVVDPCDGVAKAVACAGSIPAAEGRKTVVKTSADGLLWWDELPPQLQFNKYISSGYRANIGYGRCLCSLFQLHNETGASTSHSVAVCTTIGRWRLKVP